MASAFSEDITISHGYIFKQSLIQIFGEIVGCNWRDKSFIIRPHGEGTLIKRPLLI